jgi:hypothetical protein
MFKKALNLSFVISFFISGLVFAESGPDNGTDAVKIRFAEAQNRITRLMVDLAVDQIPSLGLEEKYSSWLLLEEENTDLTRFESLRVFLGRMRLEFQTAPCQDSQGRTASICYFDQNPREPYVVVSLLENKETTSDQAMAMLIHEAGHFVGEKDHLFLDRLGTKLVQALLRPKAISVTVSSTESVANVFKAKEECETGKSQQAQVLLRKAQAQLLEICHSRNLDCHLDQVFLSYEGKIHQEPGVGFTMQVTCELKAVLPLAEWLQL